MPRKQTTIAAIDESIAKWKTRMKRALHALDKLEQKKKRLIRANVLATMAGQGPLPPVTMIAIAAPVVSEAKDDRPRGHARLDDLGGTLAIAARESAEDAGLIQKQDDDLTIPPELNRADPLIAERMTAARKAAEAAARKAMPLSGKAASAYINKTPAKNPRKRKA